MTLILARSAIRRRHCTNAYWPPEITANNTAADSSMIERA